MVATLMSASLGLLKPTSCGRQMLGHCESHGVNIDVVATLRSLIGGHMSLGRKLGLKAEMCILSCQLQGFKR